MTFAIFLYPGVEPIDLATFGVLSMARRIAPQIQMLTVAPEPGPVVLSNGLTVLAQYGVGDCPPVGRPDHHRWSRMARADSQHGHARFHSR